MIEEGLDSESKSEMLIKTGSRVGWSAVCTCGDDSPVAGESARIAAALASVCKAEAVLLSVELSV